MALPGAELQKIIATAVATPTELTQRAKRYLGPRAGVQPCRLPTRLEFSTARRPVSINPMALIQGVVATCVHAEVGTSRPDRVSLPPVCQTADQSTVCVSAISAETTTNSASAPVTSA